MIHVNFAINAQRRAWLSQLFLGVLVAALVAFVVKPALGVILAVCAGVLLFTIRLEWGLYALLCVVFFHGLEVAPGAIGPFRDSAFFAGINAPLVDFLIFILFPSLFLAFITGLYRVKIKRLYRLFPGATLYGGFLLIALISALNPYAGLVGESTRFVLYPMTFLYLAYVVFVLAGIQSRWALDTVFRVLSVVGGVVAAIGLTGFFSTIGPDAWPRAVPIQFFGLTPLGTNHNMIAEVLVAIIPMSWYLARTESDDGARLRYSILTGFMIFIALLTLSRTAWLVLGAEAVVAWYLFREQARDIVGQVTRAIPILVPVVLIAVVSYMAVFLQSEVVISSNSARVATTEFVLFYLGEQPLVGSGPDTYIPALGDSLFFTSEFGEPLDAHGVLQKLLFETGLLGTVLFVLFLGLLLVRLYRAATATQDPQLYALFFLLFAAIGFQLFSTSYFNANLWFPIGLACAGWQLYRYGDQYLSQ